MTDDRPPSPDELFYNIIEPGVKSRLASRIERGARTLVIGVDFDKTVYSSNVLKARLAKKLFRIDGLNPARLHEKLVLDDIRRGVRPRLTARQYREVKRQVYEVEKVGLTAPDYPQAAENLRKLRSLGADLVIISNRSPKSAPIARQWLKQRGLYVKFVDVGLTRDKAEAAREHQVDIFVDNDHWKLRRLHSVVPYLIHLHTAEDEDVDESEESEEGESVIATAATWNQVYRQAVTFMADILSRTNTPQHAGRQ